MPPALSTAAHVAPCKGTALPSALPWTKKAGL